MRSSKFITMIAMTMAITAIMLLLKGGDESLRSLVTIDEIARICNAAIPDSAYNNYTSYFTNYSDTLAGLFVPSSTNGADKLIEFIKTGDTATVMTYVWSRATPYIVFIAFAAISFIGWIFYCGCCCRPCWCCKKSDNEGCYRWLSLFLVLVMYTGIVIGCIIGFSYSGNFVRGINATTCSFLIFYNDAVNGVSTTATPRWIGINSIKSTLTQTSAALDEIQLYYPSAFSGNSWTNTDPPKFEDKLKTSFTTYSTRNLDNPNPASSLKGGVTKITPIYIQMFGDYQKSGTILNSIYQEFSTKIKGSITLIDQAKTYSTNVNLYMGDIKSTLNKIKGNIDTLSNGFDQISGNVITEWINIQDQINATGINGFLVLFAILISLACASTVLLIFYAVCCKIQCLRYFLHVFWNITTIIMILTFIIGGVFGVIGLIGIDGVPVMQYILGSENLLSASPKIITDPSTTKYMNICLNGNGDLSKEFVPTGSTSNYLDQLYQVSFTLTTTKKTIADNQNSVVITSLNNQFTNYQNDITLTTDPLLGNNHVGNIATAFRGWTDSSLNTNQRGCTPSAQDVWVQAQSQCPADYTFTASGTLGNKNCLVYEGASNAGTRYSSQTGCAAGTTDFATVTAAVNSYVTSLNKYIIDNRALLEELRANNNNLNNDFVSMASKLSASLTNIEGVITPLYNIFSTIVADQGLFSLINCAFMKVDVNMVFDQMQNNLAPYSSALGGVIIAVSFMEAISVFFLLIVIFRFRDNGNNGENAHPKAS